MPTDKTKKKGGHFTPEDLAAAVAVSPDVAKLATGETVLDQGTASDLLASRIIASMDQRVLDRLNVGFEFASGRQAGTRPIDDIAKLIYQALPDSLRTQTVLQSIDVRPYLTAINGKTIVGQRRASGPLTVGEIEDYSYKIDAAPYLKAAEARATEDAVVASANGGTAPIPTAYDPTKAGITPGAPATSGITIDANGNPVLPTGGAQQDAVRFPIEGLRAAVQSGTMSLQMLAEAESANLDSGSTQYFPVDVGKPTTPTPGVPAASTDTIGALDALKYLYDLSPSEVHNMQLKMAAAGYFDRLDNGGNYIDGDPSDQNTQAAWNLLLKDSITTKRSVPAVLGEGLRNYREQVRKSRMAQLSEIDPTYTRVLANDYAQSVTGRDLTPDQLASLEQHLHVLVGQRAGYVAGATDNSGAGPLAKTKTGTTDEDVQLALQANPEFAQAEHKRNTQSLEYKLRQMMS